MSNPESSVISDIDALIDEQLSGGPVDDYSVNRYDRCQNCGSDWHGLPAYGCPGSTEKAERPISGTGAENGVLARAWDDSVREWTVQVGQPEQMTALQRAVQQIWEGFSSVIGLPENVFDPSSWCHDQDEWAAYMRTTNEEIREMARNTAMPAQVVPNILPYEFNEAAAQLRITAVPYPPLDEYVGDAEWRHLGFIDDDGVMLRHE